MENYETQMEREIAAYEATQEAIYDLIGEVAIETMRAER